MGIYCYEYVDNESKFYETDIPPIILVNVTKSHVTSDNAFC